MSALRNRVARLERQTPAAEADPIRAILLVAPGLPVMGYQRGDTFVMRQPGESDADLERRCEAMSVGASIALWEGLQ